MHLHTFKAKSLSDALRLVREELGPDASVLHTRDVASPLGRWLGGRMIEVTASAELSVPSRLPEAELCAATASRPKSSFPPAELIDYRERIRAGLLAGADLEPSLVEQLATNSDRRPRKYVPGITTLQQRLKQAGVSGTSARRWLDRLEADLACNPECHIGRTEERLVRLIASELPVAGPIVLEAERPVVVALVGPTGVGKTTTLAKLAAHFRLRQRRSVALITADTFRMAAVEQLRSYAQIMELPLEIVETPGGMMAAVQRLAQHDLLLIDTSGVSPRDDVRLSELRAMLSAAQPAHVPLVLTATADVSSLRLSAGTFGLLGANSLIMTKLDEATQLGSLLDWLPMSSLPLSYLTRGQRVPDDIEAVSAHRLVEFLLAST